MTCGTPATNSLRTFVAGFSFGATFAAHAAVRRPDLVAALVAVGMDVDIAAAEAHTCAFTRETAHQRGNRRAIRQQEAIGPPPHLTIKQFSTRAHTPHLEEPEKFRDLLMKVKTSHRT